MPFFKYFINCLGILHSNITYRKKDGVFKNKKITQLKIQWKYYTVKYLKGWLKVIRYFGFNLILHLRMLY